MKKRNFIITVALLLSVFLMFSITGCAKKGGDTVKERTFKIGHVRPEGTSTDVDVKKLAAEIASKTEDKIKLDIYAASQLGNYSVVQERIGVGDIEMQLAPAATNVTKGMGIVSAPYIVSSWDEVPVVFARDGELMAYMNKMFDKENIKILALYPKYFGGVALSKEPPAPADPYTNQGIKIRVPGIKSFEKTAQTLGFIATPIAYSEAFTAMQTGIVDGVIGSGAEGYYASFRDLTKYYLPNNDHFEMWFLMMGKDTWNSLSEKEQQIIQDAADKFEKERFSVAEQEEKDFVKKLEENGAKVYNFTKEELAGFAEKAKKEVWPVIKGDFGEAGDKFLK